MESKTKIVDQVRVLLNNSMKSGDNVERDIYRLLLAKIQTDGAETDEQAIVCVRAIINGNKAAAEKTKEEATKHNASLPPQSYFDKLENENKVLAKFLPSYLDGAGILTLILGDEATLVAVIDAKSDGAATGAVMKFLKAKNVPVEGNTVKDEVALLRKSIEVFRPVMDKAGLMAEIIKHSKEPVGN